VRILVAALLAGALALPALGQAPAAQAPAAGDPGSDWQARTEAVIGQLQRGEWAAAESGSNELLREMVAWIAGGQAAPRSLALITAFRALAEAGLGREDDALWHWAIAQQVAPEIADMKMANFGAAGALLLEQPPRRTCEEASREGGDIVKPQATERPRPQYPDALRAAGIHGTVTIEAVIGVDGTPRSPRLLTPEAPPTLVLAAAESLRVSRFTPARRAGEAVPFCFSSSMRFELVEGPRR
jgi:TonB-like protein